jgi:hypothetical protein
MRSSVRFDKPKKMREVSKVRKFMLMGALVAVVVAALAVPAMASDGFENDQQAFRAAFKAAFSDWEEDKDSYKGDKDPYNVFYDSFTDYYKDFLGEDEDWQEEGDKHRWDDGEQRWDNDWRDERRDDRRDERRNDERNNNDQEPAVSQNFQQQAQSGDVKQSFNVSNTGDNSNQCAGIQGVANTGNAQNQIGVIQYGSEADDFSFEDVGSTITVSPSNSTLCEQRVDQAASASG